MERTQLQENKRDLAVLVGLRSPVLRVDYAGEQDHTLVELSDCLPADLYKKET